jgi:gliding motility-associated transport system permease protein
MGATSTIFKRELAAYVRSPVGYVVAALLLLVDGILFQSQALGAGQRLSADVLRFFFMFTGVVTMIAAITLSIRLLAEERSQHTIVLLNTSPVRDVEIVLGKFFAAFAFLSGMVLCSIYMPLLIYVNGKITVTQLVVGYVGLLLLGGATLAIGIFASSLTRQQLVAAAVGAAITGILVLLFPLAKKLDEPLRTVLQQLDLWWVHFQGGFMNGVVNLVDVVFYLAVTYFFLLLATKTMEAKRWQ